MLSLRMRHQEARRGAEGLDAEWKWCLIRRLCSALPSSGLVRPRSGLR